LIVQGLKSTPPPLAQDHPCSTESKQDPETKKRCEFGLPNRLVGLLGSMHPSTIRHIVPYTSKTLHLFITTDDLGMLKVWDVTQAGNAPPGGVTYTPQGKLLASTTAHQGAIRAIDVYGNYILTVGSDNFVRYWELPTQITRGLWTPIASHRLTPTTKNVTYTHIAFNRHTPSSTGFFLADTLGKVTYWTITGQTLKISSSSWKPHGDNRLTGLIVRNTTQLITSGETHIKLWDITNISSSAPTSPKATVQHEATATTAKVNGITTMRGRFAGGLRLLSVASNGTWAVWDVETESLSKKIENSIDGATSLLPAIFHPTNTEALIVESVGGTTQKYHLLELKENSGTLIVKQIGQSSQVPPGYFNTQPIAYHPNDKTGKATIAFGANTNIVLAQKSIGLNNVLTTIPLKGYGVSHTSLQYGVSINRHFPLVATHGVDGKVGIWNLHTQQHLKFIEPPSSSGHKYSYAAWSADGQALFIGVNQEGALKTHSIFRQSFTYKGDIFDVTSKDSHDFSLLPEKDRLSSITYFIPHPNEPNFFAFGTFKGNVFVGEWKNGTLTLHHTKDSRFSSPEGKNILSLDFSDDGQQLAINTNNNSLREDRAFIWNWNSKTDTEALTYKSMHGSIVFTTRFWPSHNDHFWVLNQTNTKNDGMAAPLGLWKLPNVEVKLSALSSDPKHTNCKDANNKTIHCRMNNIQIAPNGRWMVTSDFTGNNHFWKLPGTPGATVNLTGMGSTTSPFAPWTHNAPRLSRSWNIMITPVGDSGKSGSGLVWAVASETPDYAE
jgi:hypothetical protein